MKNRVLGLAAIAAVMAMPGAATVSPNGVNAPSQARGASGTQLPQGGAGTMLGSILDSGGGYGYTRPTYRSRGGWTAAEAQRRKRRTRNKLRAKGQHRKAVR